jgi:hypothetical protein
MSPGRVAMPKATGLSGGGVQSGRPRSCATGALRSTRVVAGVADSEQVGRRVERSLLIFDAEYLRDRSFAAALAKVRAPGRDIVGKPKPRRDVGGV